MNIKQTQKIIVKLSESDRLANHIPEWAFKLSRKYDVYIKDQKSKELIAVVDLCDEKTEEKMQMHVKQKI